MRQIRRPLPSGDNTPWGKHVSVSASASASMGAVAAVVSLEVFHGAVQGPQAPSIFASFHRQPADPSNYFGGKVHNVKKRPFK